MGGTALFRFYAELNDFLPQERRGRDVPYRFTVPPTVMDAIEHFGVPHTEVELIVCAGEVVASSYRLRDGDRFSVFPVFESFDVSALCGRRPLREVRFIADANLGALARYLRLAGFDTLYDPGWSDAELAALSADEQRVLLTRDVGVLKRNVVTRGYFVRATAPEQQLAEVLRRFDLTQVLAPGTRCSRCNAILRSARRAEVYDRVPAGTLARYERFQVCDSCERVYWAGAQYERLSALIERARRAASGPA